MAFTDIFHPKASRSVEAHDPQEESCKPIDEAELKLRVDFLTDILGERTLLCKRNFTALSAQDAERELWDSKNGELLLPGEAEQALHAKITALVKEISNDDAERKRLPNRSRWFEISGLDPSELHRYLAIWAGRAASPPR